MKTAKQVYYKSRILSCLLFIFLCFTQGCNDPPPKCGDMRKGPYLITTKNNTEMIVQWQLHKTELCTIAWGLDNDTFAHRAVTVENGDGPDEHMHSYTLSGLEPGMKYFYQLLVGQDNGTEYRGSFYTVDDDATTLSFMVFGDSVGWTEVFNDVAGAMVDTYRAEPDFQTFTLATGDLVGDGNIESSWDYDLFNCLQPNVQEMLAHVPLVSCVGNHELDSQCGRLCGPPRSRSDDLFVKYFPYPYEEGGHYWSFDYGPAHFVMVDQYTDYSSGSEQLAWIENDLASTDKIWKFMSFHEPGYSVEQHDNRKDVRDYIQPLCEAYDVSVVFTGHQHFYARSLVNGVYHITTGGASHARMPEEYMDNLANYIEEVVAAVHFCKIDIAGSILSFVAEEPDGNIIDTFTITKK